MKKTERLKLICLLFALIVLWFWAVDWSWFAGTCPDCSYRRDIAQYRIFTFPIHSEVREYKSMATFVAEELGVPCHHVNLERWHKQKWWGLLIPSRPVIVSVGGGRFEDSLKPLVRARLQELLESNPKLPEEFKQRFLIEHDREYWREMLKKLLPERNPPSETVADK